MTEENTKAPITSTNQEVVLTFRKDKVSGEKRPNFAVKVAVPDAEGIVSILQRGGKVLDLLNDAMLAVIQSQLKGQVTAMLESNPATILSNAVIDLGKLTWEAIAFMPPKERAGSAISKEVWDAFAADYIAIMPALTGKPKETAENAAATFVKKMAPAKTRKDLLPIFAARLDLWLANSSLVSEEADDAESFAGVYTFLKGKIDEYLNTDIVLSEDAI